MKGKIGQVTLYDYNYGSALQCYATQQVVRSLGYDCVLLRQRYNSELSRKLCYLFKTVSKSAAYPAHSAEFLRMIQSQRKKALPMMTDRDFSGIRKFVDEDITSVSLTSSQMHSIARSKEYSAFLSGSDQVWNGTWFLRNSSYFLKFAPGDKRIAWAPSFGTDHIASYNKRRFAKDIAGFRFLSARETSGVRIIGELTGRTATRIIDPVLQLTPQRWRELYRAKSTVSPHPKERYVFCCFLNEPSEAALGYIDDCIRNGLSVTAFASNYSSLSERPHTVFAGGGPWEYLDLLDGSELVCTDSFHATAFALLFHRKMRTFRRNYTHSSDQSERIISLLTDVNMSGCFSDDRSPSGMPEGPLDFEFSDIVLEKERKKAAEFLGAALEGYAVL